MPTMVVVIYLMAMQKMNVHWFRITKYFGYCLSSVFVGARRFATPFRQRDTSAEELHDIIILFHTLYLVLVTIHITTNSMSIPNLLVLEEFLIGISLAVLGPIVFT